MVSSVNPSEKHAQVEVDHFPKDRDENKTYVSNHHHPPGNSASLWPFLGWWISVTLWNGWKGDLQRSGMKLGQELNHLADFVCFIGSSSHHLQLFLDPRWLSRISEPSTVFPTTTPDSFLGFHPLTGHPSCCLSQMCYPSNARQALDVHLGGIRDLHPKGWMRFPDKKKGIPPYCWWEKSGDHQLYISAIIYMVLAPSKRWLAMGFQPSNVGPNNRPLFLFFWGGGWPEPFFMGKTSSKIPHMGSIEAWKFTGPENHTRERNPGKSSEPSTFMTLGLKCEISGRVTGIPSRELTYPLPRHFWRWFSFSHGGIC